MRFDSVIHDATGKRRTSELHELGLLTVPAMLQAFAAAGLATRHLEGTFTGWGLHVARHAA